MRFCARVHVSWRTRFAMDTHLHQSNPLVFELWPHSVQSRSYVTVSHSLFVVFWSFFFSSIHLFSFCVHILLTRDICLTFTFLFLLIRVCLSFIEMWCTISIFCSGSKHATTLKPRKAVWNMHCLITNYDIIIEQNKIDYARVQSAYFSASKIVTMM